MKFVFDIIVNKLGKLQGKIITNDTIEEIVKKFIDNTISKNQVYKISHKLRNKGYLMTIKKNTFLVTKPDKQLDEEIILINHYRDQLKKHCQTYITDSIRYIGGLKALELHIQHYEIPDSIEIINEQKNALETIMFDKTVIYKKYSYKNTSLSKLLKKHLIPTKIGKYSFPIAPLELAMVESLHNPSKFQLPIINEYLKKLLRKHKKRLDFSFFELLLSHNKHHVGVNRLYALSKSIDPMLADRFHVLLKKYSFIIKE